MGKELRPYEPINNESWQFIPSHLTKALVASVISAAFGTYALVEFRQVKAVEITAILGIGLDK